MRERSYLLDKNKVADLKASVVCKQIGARRHTTWAWLNGTNAIPESYFAKLLRATERLPSDLLDAKSLEIISNTLI